jgi:hypothetical protein
MQTYNHIQINLHPAWWQDEIMSPKQRIYNCIEGRSKRTILKYEEILAKTGRINVDY